MQTISAGLVLSVFANECNCALVFTMMGMDGSSFWSYGVCTFVHKFNRNSWHMGTAHQFGFLLIRCKQIQFQIGVREKNGNAVKVQ
jgi:hypothetical protein